MTRITLIGSRNGEIAVSSLTAMELFLMRMFALFWAQSPINIYTNSMGVDELIVIFHYTALAFLPEKAYSFIDVVIADVNIFAGSRGYAVVKGRVNKNKSFTRIKKVWI
jgi:hypothetical protein